MLKGNLLWFVVWEDAFSEEYRQVVVAHSEESAVRFLGPRVSRIINVTEWPYDYDDTGSAPGMLGPVFSGAKMGAEIVQAGRDGIPRTTPNGMA